MGVKKLVDAAQNVAIRAVAGAGSGGEYFRALIINCGDGHTDLLSPAAIYDVGTQLVLNWGERLSYVQLNRMIQTTSSFTRFEYQAIDIPSSEKDLIKEVRNSKA